MARLATTTRLLLGSALLLMLVLLLSTSPACHAQQEPPVQRSYTRAFVKPAPEGEGIESGPGGIPSPSIAARGVPQVEAAAASDGTDAVGTQNLGGSNFWIQWSTASTATFSAKGSLPSSVTCPAGECAGLVA
jgi:hypothetical protein